MRGKVFVFLGRPEHGLSLSVNLLGSASFALGLAFASPTGYGLGKSGWVTARFGPGEKPPVEMLKHWIDESYCAVAPKTLVAALPRPSEPEGTRAGRRTPLGSSGELVSW